MTKVEWAIWYTMMSIVDLTLTYQGLRMGHAELNPFAAAAWTEFGDFGLLFYKAGTVLLLFALVLPLWDRKAVKVLAFFASVLLTYTVFHNLITIGS